MPGIPVSQLAIRVAIKRRFKRSFHSIGEFPALEAAEHLRRPSDLSTLGVAAPDGSLLAGGRRLLVS